MFETRLCRDGFKWRAGHPPRHGGACSPHLCSLPGNLSFYEIQALPVEDFVTVASWETVPVLSWPRVQYVVEGFASGRLISVRVRAFGAKGPGPWTEPLTARVS